MFFKKAKLDMKRLIKLFRNEPKAAKVYRLVIESCDGNSKLEGLCHHYIGLLVVKKASTSISPTADQLNGFWRCYSAYVENNPDARDYALRLVQDDMEMDTIIITFSNLDKEDLMKSISLKLEDQLAKYN